MRGSSSSVADRTALIERRKRIPIEWLPTLVGNSYDALPDNDLYVALFGGSEVLRPEPSRIGLPSALCRQLHFSLDEFRYWMRAMNRPPRLHRKDWEWFYIAQALFERGMLQEGKRGLGFAVGQEPLPSLFARYGCAITATDQAPDAAIASGWGQTAMCSVAIEQLHDANIVDTTTFNAKVSFEHADMNDVPSHFANTFDFCWSSCALEHLGSIEHGLSFIERSLSTLKPGGLAIHTTEYNLSSNWVTTQTPGSSLFRRRDIDEIIARLVGAGHHVEPVDWTAGDGFADRVVDQAPYRQSPHLKLSIDRYACTSIGLIIRKSGN